MRWCGQVFEGSDSSLLLSQLVAASLGSLDPPVNQVLSAAVKQQEQPLDFLIAVKTAGDNFLKDLEDSLGTAKQGKFQKVHVLLENLLEKAAIGKKESEHMNRIIKLLSLVQIKSHSIKHKGW